MSTPTIGRVVHFFDENHAEGKQPKAALVAFIHNASTVNLAVFDEQGNSHGRQSMTLVDSYNEEQALPFASWPARAATPVEELTKKKHKE